MTHKLGIYFAPKHDWASTWEYLRRLQPPVVRLLLPGADAAIVSRVHEAVPNARIALRWWDIDDGGESNKAAKLRDPEMHGAADARAVYARVEQMERGAEMAGWPFPPRAQLLANTLNEPPIWEPGIREKTVGYNRSFIAGLIPHRIPVAAGCINTGHPAEWPPVWDWFAPVVEMLRMSPGSVLELHEYWQLEGPNHVWTDAQGRERRDWGALAGRYQHCPFDVPILIGECGADGRLYERKPAHTGWVGNMTPDAYAEQLCWYHSQIAQDKRIVAALPFLTDYQAREWATFDTTGAHDAILAWATTFRMSDVSGSGDKPHTIHLPSIGNGPAAPETPSAEPEQPQPAPQYPPGIIDPYALEAILQVETGLRSFAGGRMVIRFEAHIFAKELDDPGLYAAHFRHNDSGRPWIEHYWRPTQADVWRAVHTGSQDSEWAAFEFARQLDETAALRSISMGAPQIMGFNHARIGYPTVQAMFAEFSDSQFHQLFGLINFILADSALADALRRKDWRTVVRLYNGPGNVDAVAPQLEAAYHAAGGA